MYIMNTKIYKIIEDKGEIYILYYSGIKRKIKNKYLKISMQEFLNKGYTIGQNVSYYEILKRDYKDYIKNKNIMQPYQFKNILNNNKIISSYLANYIKDKTYYNKYALHGINKNIIQGMKKFKNVQISESDYGSYILTYSMEV